MKQLIPVKTIRKHFSLAKDRTALFLNNHHLPSTFTRRRQSTVVLLKSRLCADCQRWNNPTIIFEPTFEPTIMSLERILLNIECITCRVLGMVILDKLQATARDLHAISSIRIHIGSAFLVQDARIDDPRAMEHYISEHIRRGNAIRCILYLQIQDIQADAEPPSGLSWHWLPSPSIGVQLSLSYQCDPFRLSQVKTWDTPFFDKQLVKSCIAKCKRHHGDCKNFEAALPPGFRVIDTEKLCVTEPSRPRSFVALSYMWNITQGGNDLQLCRGNLQQLQVPGGIDIWALPAVVADAIKLCKDLGERYLWVDRLCIVQDDSSAKHTQINAMGSVYGKASLTIVAATDPAQAIGLPGMRGRPRRSFIFNDTRLFNLEMEKVDMNPHITVDQSAWNTRAWTFQERILSLRCLYITDFQVYFSCPGFLFQEEIGTAPKGDDDNWGPPSKPSLPWIVKTQTLDGYLKHVSQYTARKLSYQTDILNAFAGVSHILAKQLGTRFVFGLPEKYFTQALLWYNPGLESRRSGVSEIPSWSWAAWLGPVHFSNLCLSGLPIAERYTGVLVKFHIQDSEKGLQPLALEETWFGEPRKFDEDASPDEQGSELDQYDFNEWMHMPTASKTNLVWRGCLQNPWELCRHTFLDPAACALAPKYPGCLVFNTTVANLCLKNPTIDGQDSSGSSNGEPGLLYHICDETGRKIGYITMGKQWVEEVIDMEKKHSFIVLCAGLLPKRERGNLRFNIPLGSGVQVGSPWLLMVMLIQRDGGVSRRLGLGYVETRLWSTVQPKWETIVLT